MDIRQSLQWADYLSRIGWTIEQAGKAQVFIRKVPFLPCSVIKIQHPQNPLSFGEIDKLAKKHRALFVLIEPGFNGLDEGTFTQNGYQKSSMSLTHTATIYIDLKQQEKQLFASFSENAKRNIKKSQINKLKAEAVFLKNEVDDTEFKKFYKLLTNLTKLKNFYVPKYSEFYKKMVAFKESSTILFAYPPVSSEKDNKPNPIAAVWLGLLGNTAVYMNTGITEEGYRMLANYLLVWEALKLAQSLKLELFDFEGIFDPRFPQHRQSWKNFSEFKKRFHGQLIEYPYPWIKWYSLPFKLLYQCNQVFFK